MKKSLSLLLTFALVISLFANMASAAETPASAGKYLQEAGIIKGTATGDLLSGSTWKRQDLAVLLSRLLNVEKEAQATKKSHTYKDVTGTFYDGYLSWAKDHKYLEGASATKFGFNGTLSNQEFAAVVLRALGVDTTGDKYASVPELAVKAKILPEGTDWKAAAKRGDTYVALVAALHTEVAGSGGKTLGQILNLKGFEVTAATAISSVTATGAKKLTVTFNGTVDAAKAKITVLNGVNTVNTKSITFSEDKKSAVIEFTNNIPAAEYTVKVEGITATALTSTVKVEAIKVTKVEFNSDKAPIVRGSNNSVITLGYKVLNQYNEDISANASISASAGKGTANASAGVVTITSQFPYVLGEKVNVNLLEVGGAFVTTTAEVSASAQVGSINFVKIYNEDGKEVVAGSDASFKLLLELKDQYGASITDLTYLNDGTDVLVTVTNPTVASLKGYSSTTNKATFYPSVTVDGKKYIYLELTTADPNKLTAGTSTVTIFSKSSPAKGSIDVVVKQNVTIDTLTLTAPASAPAGSTVNIPYTAVDQFGAAIKHPTNGQVLTASQSAAKPLSNDKPLFVKDIVKDVTNLQVKLPETKGPITIIIVTGTGKTAQVTFNVTDKQVATVISGIKDLDTAILKDGGSVEIKAGNVVTKDQYGNDKEPAFGTGTAIGDYRIKVESSDAAKVNVGGDNLVKGNTPVKLNAKGKGSATITLTLETLTSEGWKDLPNSSFTYTTKVVEKADIKSYTATVSGTVYNGGADNYAKALTVKGTLEDGSTLVIPNNGTNYTVNTTQSPSVNYNSTTGKVSVSGQAFVNVTEVELAVTVVIDAATQPQSVKFKTSNVAPAATTVSLRDGTHEFGTKEGDGLVSIAANKIETSAELNALVRAFLKVEDQYGEELGNTATLTPDTSIYATEFSSARTIGTLKAEDTFKATGITKNGQSYSFKVIVK